MTTAAIYIAGPMSGYNQYNYPTFHNAAERLRALGLTVISPAEDDQGSPLDPPGPDDKIDYAEYMRAGIHKLLTCDAIYLLPGWADSRGARLEADIARACSMTMLYASPLPPRK